jgi:dolichol-phosphate mannosyltransferase
MDLPKVSIVVPLYNESEGFNSLITSLNEVMSKVNITCEVVLINDGSKDNTPQLMQVLALNDKRYHCIFLSRNYGHQLALTAGLSFARGTEGAFIIDGDLQDPPELLEVFYNHFKDGNDVVYGVRKKRKEGFFKKMAYLVFYRILNKIATIDLPLDSGDFSFISRKVIDVINKMPEESRYIRGMRTWIGFNQYGVEYERSGRFAGESKYSLKMLFKLAKNGIFNFSEFPIRMINRLGLFAILGSLTYLAYSLYKQFFLNEAVKGFSGLLFVITMFCGVQLLSIGILGEYILRIFFQVKQRPLFIIKDRIVDGVFISEDDRLINT